LATLEASKPEPQPPRPQRPRRGRGKKVGRSSLALGEPLLWLTGGALALALFMIVGLLGLIVWHGARSFWPGPVRKVVTRDGRALMGEVTQTEVYRPDTTQLSHLSGDDREAAESFLEENRGHSQRRQFWTGNFRETQTHFDWVSDFEEKEESLPEWVLVIERLEWWRFYGIPYEFALRHRRVIPARERQLADWLAYLTAGQGRLQLEAAEQEALAAQIEALRQRLAAARKRNVDEFRQKFSAQRVGRLDALVAGQSSPQPLSEVGPDANIAEIQQVWLGPESSWEKYQEHHDGVRERFAQQHRLDKHEIGYINLAVEDARLNVRQAELDHKVALLDAARSLRGFRTEIAASEQQIAQEEKLVARLSERWGDESALASAAAATLEHRRREIQQRLEDPRAAVERLKQRVAETPPEAQKAVEQFLTVSRESDAETAEVKGEIAAINEENNRYVMRLETAQGTRKDLPLGHIVRAYLPNQLDWSGRLGVYLDRWIEFLTDEPREANTEGGVLPAIWGTVAMTLLMSLAVVPFGVLAALYLCEYAQPGLIVSAVRIAINNLAGVPSIVFGVFGLGFLCYMIGGGLDQIFFAAKLPGEPTLGKGCILWASLTLALLTLPVVIVATEEALASVPNSMREGSFACGASKWQTIRRVVLPYATPGIMTGMILAMARGAGEVAPLMLVGAVKLAPELPIDGIFPYVHLERSFMHLGFHIYDVGFQSQNSEAAKPLVFTTTLLLIVIIAMLNLTAIWLRSRLRRRLRSGQF